MKSPTAATRRRATSLLASVTLMGVCLAISGHSLTAETDAARGRKKANLPNIIFFVMDDVGVDQMRLFGYGDPGAGKSSHMSGDPRTRMPNLEAIAGKGVTFTNTWVMPDCSPSRATFFTGRMPARTGIFNPIQPPDLANAQVSPDALTLPKLLKAKGYVNGLIGKMHLSGSEQEPRTNPLGNETYRKLGFDYFNGYLDGSPLSIDTKAGLPAVAAGTYSSGFIPNTATDPVHGADSGTCYYANGTSRVMTTSDFATPGRACLESGGILDPAASPSPSHVDFNRDNGYYTARWVENLEDGVTTRSHLPGDATVVPADYRGYRSIVEANRAIAWINEKQSGDKPWMASVGFSSAHTPWHNVPASILPADSLNTDGYHATGPWTSPAQGDTERRVLQQQMEEGLDHELGRILVETGVASGYDVDGTVVYNPESSNTLVVIIGDNGTFGPAVNLPFDGARAKASPYQTGVWVPLIVAGPMVKAPGRAVDALVNGMDLYKLFAEVAGIDADKAVPKAQRLDAERMLTYLTNPGHPAVRSVNLTQTGDNVRLPEASENTTCALGPPYNAVTLFFPTKAICEKNGGVWYGPGSTVEFDSVPLLSVYPDGAPDGCEVNDFRAAHSKSTLLVDGLLKSAVRDTNYKLVENVLPNCASPHPHTSATTVEFYRVNETHPTPMLDTEANNLLRNGATVGDLTKVQQRAYRNLAKAFDKWRDTVVERCPGDGNQDLVVDAKDVAGFELYAASPLGSGTGESSWYDFNVDGKTDAADLAIINSHFGQRCRPKDNGAVN